MQSENLMLHSEVKQLRHISEITKTSQQTNMDELHKENEIISIENDKLKVNMSILNVIEKYC